MTLIQRAIELGASDAKIIDTSSIPLDPAITQFCSRCEGYGQCANCPPHAMDIHAAMRWVKGFERACVIKLDLEPRQLTAPEHMLHFRKIFTMVSALERVAREMGSGDASALGAGSCKPVFCPDTPCAVLEGKECPYPHLAKPSLEAIGINVFQLCGIIEWPLHKILRDTDPETIPSASLVGLVLF